MNNDKSQPSSRPNVWLFTHDTWLDHRLYFFYDAFSNAGADCTLFADHVGFDGPLNVDYRKVLRAEEVLFDEDLSTAVQSELLDPLIDEGLARPGEIRAFLKRVRDFHSGTPHRPARESFLSRALGASGESTQFAKWHTEEGQIAGKLRTAFGHWVLSYDSRSSRIKAARRDYAANSVDLNSFLQARGLERMSEAIYKCDHFLDTVEEYIAKNPGARPSMIYVADLPTLPVAVFLKERFGCPLMLDCHEWWKEQYAIWGDGDAAKEALIDFTEKALYKDADLALTVGALLADEMASHFQRQFDVVYTTSPMAARTVERNDTFWRRFIPDYNGQKILLFQGNLTTQRNLEVIPEIAAHLPDNVLFALAGDGGFKDELMRRVKANGTEKKVRLLGWFNQDTLTEITSHADLGFVPYVPLSKYYSFGAPNKVFEFIAAGLPFVYDPGMAEIARIAEEFSLGLPCHLRQVEESARALTSLIVDDERLKTMRQKSATARAFLSTENQEKQLFRLMKEKGLDRVFSSNPQPVMV